MNHECQKALAKLKTDHLTCVLLHGETVYTSRLRGVRPLLDLIDGNVNCNGFSAADKVVGRAAAFLYILLGVSELYALTVSRSALELLESHRIPVSYDICVEAIRNRDNTGFCPMETCVLDIEDPKLALSAIRAKLALLSTAQNGTKK